MIHKVTANQPSFRPVELARGLNVILADRTEESSRRDTRNGLGKSTLIEIIHFCLGARVLRDRGLAIPALQDWAFTMEMSLGGDRITVTRAIASPNIVMVAGLARNGLTSRTPTLWEIARLPRSSGGRSWGECCSRCHRPTLRSTTLRSEA